MSQKGFAPIYIILGLILIVAAVVGIFFLTRPERNSQPASLPKESIKENSKEVDKFIVSNPVDLSQIKNISKFRSCSGHDFSGQNISGIREENRSMKHYFEPKDPLASSIGEIKVFAPFNGSIKALRDGQDPRGKEVILSSETTPYDVTIFHMDLLPELKEDSEITAGQLIGYAHLARGHDFDISVTKFIGGMPKMPREASGNMEKMKNLYFSMIMMDSVFNHMTPDVISDFEKFGITNENIIITAEERDKNPCTFEGTDNASYWVELIN